MKKIIIDRFEGNYAVCEDEYRNIIEIDKKEIPQNAKDGDVLTVNHGVIEIDEEETVARRKLIKELQKNLFKEFES